MDDLTYMAHIEADAALLAAAIRAAGPAADVPSCPEWVVQDLAIHTGMVHRHKTETVVGRYVEDSPTWKDAPDEPVDDLAGWLEDGVVEMLRVFRNADLSLPTYTWCLHDHPASWWVRRMAHETLIHRVDGELAAGSVSPLDAELCADGVGEIIEEMMTGAPPWGTVTPGDKVIAIDIGDREWNLATATFGGTSPWSGRTYDALDTFMIVTGSDPDLTISTDPVTMDRWLWGRGELPDDVADGEASLVAHVRRVAAESTG